MSKVAVLMGGWSPEREVSLVSGKACAAGLREAGHEVIEYDVKRDLRALIDFLRPAGGGGPDVVFNALHGKYGEDGCIQGVLEILAVPYTHSGVLASAIAMDKPMSRHVFTSARLKATPGDQLAIARRINEIDAARADSQPRSRTGGSTFANPAGHKAWELIDRAGCRGLKVGGAQVSEKHTNFLINTGAATASDIEKLGEEVRRRVFDQSGVELQWEIRRLGEFA